MLAPALAVAAFTLEEVCDYPFPGNLVAARAGPQIAWTINDKGRRNVWVATSPDFKPRQLTAYDDDDGQEISSLLLSNDGATIVYVRGGDPGANWDEELPANPASAAVPPKVEIWSVPFSGGEPRRVAEGTAPQVSPDGREVAFIRSGAAWRAQVDGRGEAAQLFATKGRVASLRWSPDGARIAFVSRRDPHSLIGVYSRGESTIRWIAPTIGRDEDPRWSPDGRHLAFTRRGVTRSRLPAALHAEPEPWSIWVADANGDDASLRWSSGNTRPDSYQRLFFEWAGNGRIVFQSWRDGWPHLYSLFPSSGDALQLTRGDFAPENISLDADGTTLLFDANAGDTPADIERRHVYSVPTDRAAAKALTRGSGLEWTPVRSGESVVFISAEATRPPVLSRVANDGGKRHAFGAVLLPKTYPADRLVTPRDVTFRAPDGQWIRGQLFEPASAGVKHPALVYLHGGPRRQMMLGWHPMPYYANAYALNQYLASRGFIVLAVNYRSGTGYGYEFQFPLQSGARGAADYQDVRAAGTYLSKRTDVDMARIGLFGGSYGGYLTAMGLARDPDLFKAGVDLHGVHDWVAHYDLSSRDAENVAAVAWQSSPVSMLDRWTAPVLFIHGDDDRNVRFSQTTDFVRRLQAARPVTQIETIVLVDETHALLRHHSMLRSNRSTAEFFERQFASRR